MYNRKHYPHFGKFQRGISLMELMVGLTIGLMVVVAALGSLVFTQISSKTVGDSARLQQKADNTFRILGFHVQQAGAINLVSNATEPSKVAFSNVFTGYNPTTTGATAGQIFSVHGLHDGTTVLGTDTLRISYQDNGAVRDCLGNQPPAAQIGIRVDNQFSLDSTTNELKCLGANAATGAQPVVDGVEDFQVSYGVQTFLANGTPQFQFYRADQITDWTNVEAVVICLQLVGDNKGNPQPASFVVTGCRGQTVTNDGLLRRVFRRSYGLRNALL